MKAIEIKIRKHGQRRIALYREAGSKTVYWHLMPVRQAEKAIQSGIVSIGLSHNVPAVTAI